MCRFNNFKWNNDLLEDQSSFLAINSQVGTVLQMVIVFGLGEQNVSQQEDLCRGKRKCSSKEKVGIGRPCVDPQVPEDGTEHWRHKHDATDDKRMPENWIQKNQYGA